MNETIVLNHYRVPLDQNRSFERTVTAQINRQTMRERAMPNCAPKRAPKLDVKDRFASVIITYWEQKRPQEHIDRLIRLDRFRLSR